MSYYHEKCMIAVEAMAISSDPLRERLANAYISALMLIDAPDVVDELPTDAREALRELNAGVAKSGNVDDTLAQATDAEVSRLAKLAWAVMEPALYRGDDVE